MFLAGVQATLPTPAFLTVTLPGPTLLLQVFRDQAMKLVLSGASLVLTIKARELEGLERQKLPPLPPGGTTMNSSGRNSSKQTRKANSSKLTTDAYATTSKSQP